MPQSNENVYRRRAARRRAAMMKQRNFLITAVGLLSILLVALLVTTIVLSNRRVTKQSVTLEAGGTVTAQDFLVDPSKSATLLTTLTQQQLSTPGEYPVTLLVDEMEYQSVLIVSDTTAPTAKAAPTTIQGVLPAPEELLTDIQDVGKVTVTYVKQPDITVAGDFDAVVRLTDAAGNTTDITVTVTVVTDTVKPVIEVVPYVEHSVYLDDTIPYKTYVTYSDDKTAAENLTLKVDRSQVDTAKPGTYDVVYTVIDEAGNEASVTIQLTIKAKPTGYVEPEVAYGMARNVLAQITTPDMTQAEIAAAIYNYVKLNIAYTGSSDKNRGWAAGAVDGFSKHAGDCYTYFATAKALYDVAGITNMDVVKVKTPNTSSSSHYWSIINIGGGWYHVDCTPRANEYTHSFFMYTDQEMLDYSAKHSNCFNFDLTAYPPRATESVQAHIQLNSNLKVTIKESW